MTTTAEERRYLSWARVGRLATADADGCPHVVPCCFALLGDAIITPLDEKPKDADHRDLRRVRDVEENGFVSLVADHYREDWAELGVPFGVPARRPVPRCGPVNGRYPIA